MMSVAIILLVGLIMFVTVQLVVMRSLVERIKALETITIMKVKPTETFHDIKISEIFTDQHNNYNHVIHTLKRITSKTSYEFICEKWQYNYKNLSPKQKAWVDDIFKQFLNEVEK